MEASAGVDTGFCSCMTRTAFARLFDSSIYTAWESR